MANRKKQRDVAGDRQVRHVDTVAEAIGEREVDSNQFLGRPGLVVGGVRERSHSRPVSLPGS